jgi:hypothetical protein
LHEEKCFERDAKELDSHAIA